MIEFTDWDESLINYWVLLILLFGLLSSEWLLRKLNGVL